MMRTVQALILFCFFAFACSSVPNKQNNNNLSKDTNTEVLPSLNIFNEDLQPCCNSPITGFYRDGLCNTGAEDFGQHVVCCVLTNEFLDYSLAQGNDLKTPKPERHFPGLKEGDKWCICLSRWEEAYRKNVAPNIDPHATHKKSLELIPIQVILDYSTD